jgi:hypothetical protein
MLFNEFIDKMLDNMSAPIPRLRNPLERLTIQFELQNDYVFNFINYFMMLLPEYRYNWHIMQKNDSLNGDYLSFHNISNFSEFIEFHNYMVTHNIFNFDEAEWLEDAIHEILVE